MGNEAAGHIRVSWSFLTTDDVLGNMGKMNRAAVR